MYNHLQKKLLDKISKEDLITKECLDEITKDLEKPKKNGRKGYDYDLLAKALDESDKLYTELTNNGKIDRYHKSSGVDKRSFQAKILNIGEGTISNVYQKRHKCQLSLEENNANERKSVCEKLINPLLKKLDYKERHYYYNKPIHMGNKNNNITSVQPDYQLLPNQDKLKDELDKKFKNTTQIIIEAKLESINEETAYLQAITYARRLCAPYIVIATNYRLRIFHSDNNYITSKLICEYTWSELEDDDKLNEIKKLIGKKNFTFDKITQTYVRKQKIKTN